MGERQIDPGQLEGEDLRRWYLRSPEEVEVDRRGADSRRYQDFFDPAPLSSLQGPRPSFAA